MYNYIKFQVIQNTFLSILGSVRIRPEIACLLRFVSVSHFFGRYLR